MPLKKTSASLKRCSWNATQPRPTLASTLWIVDRLCIQDNYNMTQ